jgi:DNA-binding IclR family transcriptional regulator
MNHTIKSINRVFDILELFVSNSQKLGISEIAKKLNINKPAVSRIMTTLESKKIVQKGETGRKYQLTNKFIELARVYQKNIDLKDISLKYLKSINNATGETTHLDILEGDKRVSIASVESKRPIRVIIPRNNQMLPIHTGAAGKVLLAYLPEYIIDEIANRTGLPKYAGNTITDKFQLIKELKLIRSEGVAFSESEFTDYVCSVAAPVKDFLGKVVAAIAISWPSIGNIAKKREEYSKEVKKAADELSIELGYQEKQ